MAKTKMEYLWQDRKRFMGMPLSFTRYKLGKDRLFTETGFFSTKYEEIVLYRVRDISLKRSLWQKIFGVGTIVITSSDSTCPTLVLKNIKRAFDVKEAIHKQTEAVKIARRSRVSEVIGEDDDDLDGDGIPDSVDEDF